MTAPLSSTEQRNTEGNFDLFRLSKSKPAVDISPNTIRKFAKEGLRIYKHGKAAFVSRTELAAHIRAKAA